MLRSGGSTELLPVVLQASPTRPASGRQPELPVIIVGGGQSGLAAARALSELGEPALILEAGDRPAGSWPQYYDSLRLFSPSEHSAMPGAPFPGPPDGYPSRDDVVAYLEQYASDLPVEVRTNTRVETIRTLGGQFVVITADGEALHTPGLVAASGSFSTPYRPHFAGQEHFTAELVHVADYRCHQPYAGKRIIVVGAGDSAAQVATELSAVSQVTLATRHPVRFIPQHVDGKDVHYWYRETGFDALPAAWLSTLTDGSVVTDSVGLERALAEGRLDRRPMFDALDGNQVLWSDGTHERVNAIILATGYRPSLDYLRGLGALDESGVPLHAGGISTTHPGLVYVGLEYMRAFASNTLRGVGEDARAVITPLVAWVRNAPAVIGLPSLEGSTATT